MLHLKLQIKLFTQVDKILSEKQRNKINYFLLIVSLYYNSSIAINNLSEVETEKLKPKFTPDK